MDRTYARLVAQRIKDKIEKTKEEVKSVDNSKKTPIKASFPQTFITATTLGIASLVPGSAQGQTVSQDDHQSTSVENVDHVSQDINQPTSFFDVRYSIDDIKQIAYDMYLNSMENFINTYVEQSLDKFPRIRQAGKKGKECGTIKEELGIDIKYQGQHCAEGGTKWFFNKFTPQFLIDSLYKQYENPNYAPTIFKDMQSIARKYCGDKYKDFFMMGNTNIYQKIKKYNKDHNPNNEPKIFFCEETNKVYNPRTGEYEPGRHFTVIVYNGGKYYRIGLNSADAQEINGYSYAESRIGPACDVTKIAKECIGSFIKEYIQDSNNKLSNTTELTEEKTYYLLHTLAKMLSSKTSDTYVVDPNRGLEQLVELQKLEQYKNYPKLQIERINPEPIKTNVNNQFAQNTPGNEPSINSPIPPEAKHYIAPQQRPQRSDRELLPDPKPQLATLRRERS